MRDHVEDAVENNASWCDVVCRAAGLTTRWSPAVWSVDRRSPDGYPDAVTRRRGLDAVRVLAAVEEGDGCSVKDSFADLDLSTAGFGVLFEATWIRRPGLASAAAPTPGWDEVRTAGELASWCRRLDVPPLPPVLLDQPGLHVLSATGTGAGFALSRTGAAVGISHAVPGSADPATLWSDLVALAGRLHPGADLVGYEGGTDLAPALAAGFTATGPLRVWIR